MIGTMMWRDAKALRDRTEELEAEVDQLREGWAREDLDEAFEAGREEGYEEAAARIAKLEAEQ